jgi:hypothetical protein
MLGRSLASFKAWGKERPPEFRGPVLELFVDDLEQVRVKLAHSAA